MSPPLKPSLSPLSHSLSRKICVYYWVAVNDTVIPNKRHTPTASTIAIVHLVGPLWLLFCRVALIQRFPVRGPPKQIRFTSLQLSAALYCFAYHVTRCVMLQLTRLHDARKIVVNGNATSKGKS